MSQTRRAFLCNSARLLLAGTAFSSGLLSPLQANNSKPDTTGRRPIRAIAFDAFPIFDP